MVIVFKIKKGGGEMENCQSEEEGEKEDQEKKYGLFEKMFYCYNSLWLFDHCHSHNNLFYLFWRRILFKIKIFQKNNQR